MSTQQSARTVVGGIRGALLIGGVLAVVVGILILVWPGKTAMVVAGIIAAWAVIAGVVNIALGVLSRSAGAWSRVGHIVLGLIFLIAGIVAFSNLGLAAGTLATFVGALVGILWIVEGVVSLTTLGGTRSRGWTIAFAVLSIVAGVLILFAPVWGALVLWVWLGISLILLGAIQIVRATRLRTG
ncbi:uncharacterized membrane protein HdeD (DUF308 family) [Microbacterium sp. SORGH_AS 505]|uniref:HdeD family acid-resistance protein n=1 Tax=Microbacterium sp. SORGH_AS_0505 TaxID=3041770 RepID=UPI00278A4B96|nr:DUF308 domain-containing protein [Microbacterium sp. SORGH_AS_0505]MDQ1126215.1 uncharacterized membrane protein HdeD (DUF308 family) [Microbacterium sp. SORGH_AS_0505]